jgi:hypothetical protein
MSNLLTRRLLVKSSILSSIFTVSSLPSLASVTQKKFILSIQAQGAWDVTLFCDPKTNQAGEAIITNWSLEDEIQTTGNLNFAPFGNNQHFFEKYRDQMLVINGIDSQTNAHGIGITYNWSGRLAAGYPSLTALHSTLHGSDLPMPYISLGSTYSNTADLIISTVAQGGISIQNVLRPNNVSWGGQSQMDPEFFDYIIESHKADTIKFSQATNLLPFNRTRGNSLYSALDGIEELENLGFSLPSANELYQLSNAKANAIVALSGFKAGTTVAADIGVGNFDSHASNDSKQLPLLNELTDMIDYVWETANTMGIADDLILVIGSDFSRTPYYNSAQGKDHWSVGSYIIMENNPTWGNQVIGATDEVQNALKINPSTLKIDSQGEILTPAHIHKELRRYLGISGTALDQLFPINVDNEIRFLT